eukprot:1173852-Prorocentrum_minimum.AAC.1
MTTWAQSESWRHIRFDRTVDRVGKRQKQLEAEEDDLLVKISQLKTKLMARETSTTQFDSLLNRNA